MWDLRLQYARSHMCFPIVVSLGPLRDEYAKIQRDLQQTTSAVSKLEQENSRLKLRTAAPGANPEAVDQLAAEQARGGAVVVARVLSCSKSCRDLVVLQ